jgi:cytoskeletal protein CcmA (bactofilin family)
LIVGRNVSVSGEIKFCDRLVVAGNVEASLHECRELEISNQGVFQGNAVVAVAEIRGRFEGDLVVRKHLVIRSTGRISGSIIYGEIEIESGAEVAGILMPGKENGMKLLLPALRSDR